MRINEIFYSIQGEGYHAGIPAVFVRFAGCNLRCDFCDTNHQPYKEYSEDDIVRQIASYNANFVVFTGGEPTLQLTESLVDKVHAIRDDMFVAVESNGTHDCVGNVNWLTISPKDLYLGEKAKVRHWFCNEIKVVWDGVVDINNYINKYIYAKIEDYYIKPLLYIQPCDTGDIDKNKEIINKCVEFVKQNPKWKLSIQLQKILNVR